ncbi:MAG: Uma2 family endonuclease [Bacteroidota bacterium]
MVAIASKQSVKKVKKTPVQQKISWSAFQKEYLTKEDELKYEWVDGYVEKTLRSTDKTQFRIQRNLVRFFYSLFFNKNVKGDLIAEGDTRFLTNHRRPDLAYYTDEQIEKAANKRGVTPEFVLEVISTNDQVNALAKKMRDYRAAEVKVVWLIFPELKEIHVYRGLDAHIHEGDSICSADEVITGFQMKVSDVFK